VTTPFPDDREVAHFEETLMSAHSIVPANTRKVAPKVAWGALASLVATAVLTTVAGAIKSGQLVEGLPNPLAGIIAGVLTSAATALAGYLAPHQARLGEANPVDHDPYGVAE
jgi:hypothetical protein